MHDGCCFRSHEKVWLSLLQQGTLLVLKGGIHQFMLQPGIVDEYRKEAVAFASAAHQGKAISQIGDTPAELAVLQTQQQPYVSHDGVGLLANNAGDATDAQPSRGVGLWEGVRNLWAQRRNKKQQ